MANVMTQRGSQDNVITYTHFCDTAEDKKRIDPRYITLGSVCVVLEDENNNNELTFYLGKSDKTWKQV